MSGEKLDAVIEEQERVLRFRSIDLDTISGAGESFEIQEYRS